MISFKHFFVASLLLAGIQLDIKAGSSLGDHPLFERPKQAPPPERPKNQELLNAAKNDNWHAVSAAVSLYYFNEEKNLLLLTAQDDDGKTALIYSVINNNPKILQAILNFARHHNLFLNLLSEDQIKTAIELAVQHSYKKVLIMLYAALFCDMADINNLTEMKTLVAIVVKQKLPLSRFIQIAFNLGLAHQDINTADYLINLARNSGLTSKQFVDYYQGKFYCANKIVEEAILTNAKKFLAEGYLNNASFFELLNYQQNNWFEGAHFSTLQSAMQGDRADIVQIIIEAAKRALSQRRFAKYMGFASSALYYAGWDRHPKILEYLRDVARANLTDAQLEKLGLDTAQR